MGTICYNLNTFTKSENTGFFLQETHGRKLMDTAHKHNFFEVIFIYSGGSEHIVNGISDQFSSGEMILLRPGDIHYFAKQQPGTSIISLSVSDVEMQKFIEPYENNDYILNRDKPVKIHLDLFEQKYLYSSCFPIIASNSAAESSNIQYCKIILGIILPMFQLKNYTSKSSADFDIPPAFSELISNMMSPENIHGGIDAMLSISNFSHSHLCRMFKKYMNMSPHQYITSLRMNYAFDLVASSDMTFESIAETVGYSSFSHFSLKFKETYHKTVSAIRKEYKSKANSD